VAGHESAPASCSSRPIRPRFGRPTRRNRVSAHGRLGRDVSRTHCPGQAPLVVGPPRRRSAAASASPSSLRRSPLSPRPAASPTWSLRSPAPSTGSATMCGSSYRPTASCARSAGRSCRASAGCAWSSQGAATSGVCAHYPLPRANGLHCEFIDCPALFHRDDFYTQDADEHLRWAAFSRMVVEACQQTGWAPGRRALQRLARRAPSALPAHALRLGPAVRGTRTLLSIHNIGYQGRFGAHVIDEVGLGEHRALFHQDELNKGRQLLPHGHHVRELALDGQPRPTRARSRATEHGMGLQAISSARNESPSASSTASTPRSGTRASRCEDPRAVSRAEDISGKRTCRERCSRAWASLRTPRAP
jgi:hypothetical protein